MWDLVRMKCIDVRNHCFVFEASTMPYVLLIPQYRRLLLKVQGLLAISRVLIAHKGGKVVAAELGNALYSLGYAI
ncbi:hypothetical protein HanPSC8_Chr09g0366201 [Helianthus annuus]|nr:hypothetical protein HanPSC8_Chr09g0366201 [Helianthus annuus]